MRFFFYYSTGNVPIGGLKQIRLMATLLNTMGVEACLLRDRGLKVEEEDDNRFYQVSVPEAPFTGGDAEFHLRPEDMVVFSEYNLEESLRIASRWRCRKVVYNQNGFYALECRPFPGYAKQGIEFVIAITPSIAAITRDYLRMDTRRIFQVPVWVVRGVFAQDHTQNKRKLGICYMPRKLPDHIERVREMLSRSHPDVPWVEIDRVPEEEVARRFSENALFLSTQHREGCPLPALEAMACGCLVAGYPGTDHFPHPYATRDNGFWATDGDPFSAAAQLRQAIAVFREAGPRFQQIRAACRETIQHFTEDAVREALQFLLDAVASRTYHQTRAIPNLGWRARLHAFDIMRKAGRLHLRLALRTWLGRKWSAKAAQA